MRFVLKKSKIPSGDIQCPQKSGSIVFYTFLIRVQFFMLGFAIAPIFLYFGRNGNTSSVLHRRLRCFEKKNVKIVSCGHLRNLNMKLCSHSSSNFLGRNWKIKTLNISKMVFKNISYKKFNILQDDYILWIGFVKTRRTIHTSPQV
jgi:hypothetical protein